MSDRTFTYQTRVTADPVRDAVLDEYARRYGHIERCLFAQMQTGQSAGSLKNEFLRRFQITARQFNALRVGLEGKIASILKRRPGMIREAAQRIDTLEATIRKIERPLCALGDPQSAIKQG